MWNRRPAPALAGAGLAFLAFLTMGQAAVTSVKPPVVQFGPHPRDYVQIKEGAPYVVPAGKLLTVTALGGRDFFTQYPPWWGPWELWIDGALALRSHPGRTRHTSSVHPVPTGLVAAGGSTVEVRGETGSSGIGRAWGHLSEELPPSSAGSDVRVPYQPHPSDVVRFGSGAFYIVPPDKRFVLTGLGGSAGQVYLRVNAQQELSAYTHLTLPHNNPSTSFTDATDGTSIRPVPIGFAVPAGSILEVVPSGAQAWGYLAGA
jgi:hypothetical protein